MSKMIVDEVERTSVHSKTSWKIRTKQNSDWQFDIFTQTKAATLSWIIPRVKEGDRELKLQITWLQTLIVKFEFHKWFCMENALSLNNLSDPKYCWKLVEISYTLF